MPKRTKPRSGSLQFWPRKRSRRIYPRINAWANIDEVVPLGFAAWKVGMTHVRYKDNNTRSPTYGKTITKPATVLDAPSLLVCGIRFYKKTSHGLKTVGEKWIKVRKDLEKKVGPQPAKREKELSDDFLKHVHDVKLIVSTQPKKSGMKKKKPEVLELGLGGSVKDKLDYANKMLGKEINATDVFKKGECVDVVSITKGHGFQGPVKRFGIKIQGRKDQQHHRHVGSIGATVPRKVDWRVPSAGQYGFFQRTEINKRVLDLGNEVKKVTPDGGFLGYGLIPSTFMLIEGSIPGSRKRLVVIKKSKKRVLMEPMLEYISLESKQGV
jgi:large subunit ribosomal protein L3